MKISELIVYLEQIKNEHGDLFVGGTVVGNHVPNKDHLSDHEIEIDTGRQHVSLVTIEDYQDHE